MHVSVVCADYCLEVDGNIPCRQVLVLMARDAAVNSVGGQDYAVNWRPTLCRQLGGLIGVHILGRQGTVGGHPLDANPLLAAIPLTSTVQLTTTDVDIYILLRNSSRFVNARIMAGSIDGNIPCHQVLELTARDAAVNSVGGQDHAIKFLRVTNDFVPEGSVVKVDAAYEKE
ncbi:hypothetical protein Taro_018675 [Colocasia esculenta]|uniref:Uncharacterized protein n=1 Tax=Colocasia esculenta TaxID=4460 RepID=A0A843UWY1_COLES|nr:hypothetical protein [Colocasia esculenta]